METPTPTKTRPGGRSSRRKPFARPHFEPLESRLLMSADLPMAPLVPPSVEPSPAPAAVHFLAPRELVVLDAALPDADTVREAIANDRPDADLLILDPERDALDQIGERLAGGVPASAIHLVAHGQAGQFVIRGAVIDASELARRTAQLQTWNLSDHADILLYGCNVADGANGEAFVRMLAALTRADVAASTDLTGSEDRGGDWTLEFVTGDVDTATIAGPRLKGRWHGTLAAVPAGPVESASPSFSTPLAFERNAGQTDAAVEFLARGSGYTVFLDDGNAVIDVRHGDGSGNVVRLSLEGAQAPTTATGETPLAGTSHYLIGDTASWRTDVDHHASVRYEDVYAGIDVRYYGTGRQLQYDFLLDAGTDADVIGLRFGGADSVTITDGGTLVLTLDSTGRTLTFAAPVSYQETADGTREHVDSRYVLRADGTVGFHLGDHDRTRDLVIDPILGYATYLGGTGLETIEGVETDANGNVYVTGRTGSAAFPTSVGAYDTALSGSTDAFVTKFNSAGALQYSTYFGGSGDEWAYNLAVDGSGQVYVAGQTASSDLAIVNGADSSFGGSTDGYLVKLNAAGSAILYSTYFGGANADYLGGVHVGTGSTIYVAGATTAATWDGYAAAINTGTSGAGSLTWSHTFTAAGTEKLYDMDVDSTGDIWLIGETSTAGLGTGSPYDSTHNGGADVFLVRMSASGAVEYVSYYGGTDEDYGNALVVAADDTLYLTGISFSTAGIASTGAYDTAGDATNGNAFLVHLDPSQTGSAQRLFGTYYGTSGSTFGIEIALDAQDRPVIVGETSGTVPTTVTARDTTPSGGSDGFVAIFAEDGSALRYGSYLGGAGTDWANAVAVDPSGRIYVVGDTASTNLHTTGAYDTTGDATNGDGFIAQLLPLGSQATATVGGGLSLNTDGGNDAYLKADDGGAILGGRTELTLEFDFAVDTSATVDNRLLSYAISGVDNEVAVHITATGSIVFTIENATTTSASTHAQLLDGNRHQLAITWTRSTGDGAFYVDGALVQSFSGFKTFANIDSGGTLVIGQDQDSVDGGYNTLQMLSGTLYDVRVFSDVRTATEIKAGRLADLPRYESGMVANWRFDDWHADRTTTEAVSGNDLTLGHATGTGFVASHPELTFLVNENTATGTVVGAVAAVSDDRQARIDALLAADATLTYSAQTDKFYKLDSNWISWPSALTLATSTSLNGVAGQMVTIHSATENEIVRTINGAWTVWLGASDTASEGTWRWYDGGSPGETFWQGTSTGYRVSSAYTNFSAGQPDDYGNVAIADQLYMDVTGTWDDADAATTSRTLIEWDADEVLDAYTPITYSITSQTVSGAFAIDSDTGTLTVADGGRLNYVAGVPHTLTVRVTEGSLTYDRDYTIVLADEAVEVSASVPGAQSATEDTSLTFSSGGGNAITVSDASGSNTRLQVSLSVSNGTLALSQTTGLTIVSGTNGSAAMVIDGTESALNAALSGMTYTPTAEYSGADTLQLTASLSADLAGHYTFDTGAVVDSAAGTAQNGSFAGNATTTTDATRGTVLSLDGSGDSVQIASVFGSPTNVTVGGWVNLYNAPNRGEMISLNDGVHIALDQPGVGVKGSIQTGAGTWNDLESGRFLAGDGWHHVMFVVDDTNDINTLYIDGIEVASESNTSSVYWTGATTTYFGQHPGGSYYLQGLLDDMRVYTRALSAGEIAALAAEQRLTDPDTIALTVSAVNDAPADLYFVPGLAESSLTGVYTFSVSSDLGRDAAGEDAAITLYGSPSQTTGPGGGGALDLAGGVSGQYGDIAGITTGGAMTIAGDVRFDSTAIWQRVVDFGQANSTGITAIYVGRYGTTNDLTFTLEKDLGGGNWLVHRAIATGAITNGAWLHFAATVDGSGAMVLYVNGVLADTEAGVVPEVGVRTNNYVGRSNWAGDALFDGAIDNLVVASGALSATGVAALYQQSNAVSIAENSADGTVLGTIVVADIDSANTHSFSLTSNPGTRFAIAADGTLTVANGSLLDYETATSHAITARATDAGSLTRDEVFTVTLTAVNEAPSFVSLNGTPAHTEGGAVVVLDADVQITDPELSAADAFSGATLTLARNGGANSDDALAFDGTNVTVSGANVSVGGTQIGTYVFTGGELVVTFGANASQARVNTLLQNIVYWNWSDAPPATVQIDWTFNDGNTGTQGTGGALQATGSTTVTITAVNDAPVITGLDGDVRTYTEGGAAVLVGSTSNITDVDSANFDGGTLTVSFTGGSDAAEDVLAIRNQGTGAGQIGVSGANVTYGGVIIGTWSGGTGGSNLVITLDADATTTETAALINNITYVNTDADNPTTTTRNIRFVLTDGDGGTSVASNTFMSVTAVNDAPVNTIPGLLVGHTPSNANMGDQAYELKVGQSWGQSFAHDSPGATYSVGDVQLVLYRASDAPAGQTVTVSLRSVWNGAVIASGTVSTDSLSTSEAWVSVVFSSAATLNDTQSYVLRVDSSALEKIYVGVADSGTYASGHLLDKDGVTQSGKDLAFVLDAPLQTAEETPLTLSVAGGNALSVADVDAGSGLLQVSLTMTGGTVTLAQTAGLSFSTGDGTADATLVFSGTLAALNAALDGMTFQPTANFNGVASIALTTSDLGNTGSGGALVDSDTQSILVTATDDPPVFSGLNGTPTHVEGGAAVVLDANVTVSDTELTAADDFSGATLTLARNGGANSDDALAFDGTNVTVSGANVLVGGTQVGTYVFTGGELVVTFGANATQARVNTLLQNIVYWNWSDAPPATVQMDWTFNDGNSGSQGSGSAQSTVGSTTVSITAVNDAPVLNNASGPVLATVTEDAAAPSGAVGTLVSTLVDFASPAGQIDNVTDADGGAVLGIAVTDADATNGTWFYSTNNGATWNALGAVSAGNARLLAADAGTRLYFQGNANFAGTITNAITFHAWDRTSGVNGSVADIGDDTVLDRFSSVSYANNDGTTNWTSAWIETDVDGGGASGGRLLVRPTGDLEIRARATNNNLYREVDLSGKSAATLSFDFVNTLSSGDTIVVQASGNGGGSYTTLTGGTFSSSLNTGSGTFSVDVSSFIAANTRIRFLVSSVGGEDRLYVDNVQVTFPSALTGGSTAFSVASDTASLTVSAGNDAPAFANLDGTPTHVEGGSPVVLDANVTLSDTELTAADAFSGATLTLARNGGANNDDALAFDGTNVTVSGANVLVGGTQVGTYVFTGGQLVVTFGANATQARVNTLLQNVVYRNWSDAPPAAVQIDWTFNDGNTGSQGSGGALQATGSTTVTITAVNDTPTAVVLDAGDSAAVRLNTTTSGDQSQPAIAALPGGGWVAVWTSAGQDGDGTGIYAQRFAANGVSVGSEFRVNASATYHQGSPSVATFSDGAFVVGWTEMQPGVAAWAEARVFAADGTPLTGDLTISVPLSNPNEGYAAQVQVLGPNRWAIVWSNEVNGAARSVEGRIFDRAGVAQTARFTVGTSGNAPDSWAVVPRTTGLADGGMAVTWNHYDTGSQTTIRVQFVNTDGTLRGAFAELSGTGIGDITQLPDGRVVVLSTDGGTVYATVFSSAGAIVVPDFVVTTSHVAPAWPQVTASGDGFVAAWVALADDGVTQEIVARTYDATGAPLGVTTRARPSTDGAVGDIALTTLADGSALLGWRADGLDGSGGGAYVGVLQAAVREGAANGTVVARAIDVLDPDGGDTHTFTLFDDAGGRFTINGVTGRITVANSGLLDYESSTTHTIIVRATDGGGLSVDRSLTIAVLPVNEAPVFSNLDATPAFTENGAAVVLDADVTVGDAELTAANSFNGATLTLGRSGGASAQDQFSATGTLSALTQGGTLVVGGITIGTVTSNSAGSLVLTFNGNATNALVNSALQQIAYANASDTPPASVQINWSFGDGNTGAQGSGGALTATGSTTVSITAVNDAPTGGVAITGITAESETLSADTSGLADGDGLGAFAYQWLRDGAPIAGATASSHTLVSGDVGRGISVRVSYTDGQGTLEQLTSAVVGPVTPIPTPPVNAAPVNAAPVEDTLFAFTGADTISIADGDGNLTTVSASVGFGTLALTLSGGATVSSGALGSSAFTLSGSLAALNASLASLAYTPDADFNGTDTLTLVSTDATSLSDTDTITLTVTPVDDAPVLTGLTLSVAQGGVATLSTADFVIVDPDGPGGTRVVDVRNLSQGTFELATAPGVPVTSFDFADVAAGLVRFVHSGAGAAPSFEASVRDSLAPGTFVPAAIGFTPTPVITTPGPSPEQAYSIVLTPTAPPSGTRQDTSGPTRPADPVTTGTASQSGDTPQGGGGRGERSPGSVDPLILMQMAVPRTPAPGAGDPPGTGDAGRDTAMTGPIGGAAAVGVSAPTAAPIGSSGVAAGPQVPTAEAVTPAGVQSAWNAPAPLTVALPGDGPASGPENRSADEQQFEIMVNGVRLTGVSLSVGVVTWALRAGGIVSSLLASLPAWRFVDPLPVLERAERTRVVWRDDEEGDGDDDTAKRERAVEDLFGGPS